MAYYGKCSRERKRMTAFTKETILDSSGWLTYAPQGVGTHWKECKFIANFAKRGGGKASFITFLIKNFTVEEYFAGIEAGKAPLKIVEEKGYLLPHIKKWLKEEGYPVSRAGYEQYIADRVSSYQKKVA